MSSSKYKIYILELPLLTHSTLLCFYYGITIS